MGKSLTIIFLLTATLITLAFIAGDSSLVLEGLTSSLHTAMQSALMLFVSFIVIGQIQALVTKEAISKWLHRFSGIKGIIISAVTGGLFPGGPYIYYAFVDSFTGKEVPFYILITFIFGKNVYDLSRIPMEVSLINWQVALIRNLITLPIPILVGMMARHFYPDRTLKSIFPAAGESNDADHNHS